jgi:drug/metabolite transporter (DMT)-like permease
MCGILMGVSLDITGKWLLADYSLPQFVLLRSLFGGLMLMVLVQGFGGWKSLHTRRPGWHLLRTLLATGAMFGFFWGLSQMKMVDALTLSFTAPLMTTALSAIFLRDHVGWRRWAAVAIGFTGVLVILQPGSGLLTWAAFGVLAAAFFYAGIAVTSRHLSDTENTYAMSLYVLVGPVVVAAFGVSGNWQMPPLTDWLLFAFAGVCSAGAWLGIVNGYRRASPALLAPFEYTALLWGALGGYLIWSEVPGGPVILGATIIIASGLFVAYREIQRWAGASRYLRVTSAGKLATQAEPESPD